MRLEFLLPVELTADFTRTVGLEADVVVAEGDAVDELSFWRTERELEQVGHAVGGIRNGECD